jgi:hypothetical protein
MRGTGAPLLIVGGNHPLAGTAVEVSYLGWPGHLTMLAAQ